MDMTGAWPIIVAALGSGGFFTVAIQEIFKYRSGRAQTERIENLTLLQRAQYAEALAEWADSCRRIALEHASACRRIALDHGARVGDLDPWPEMPDKPPKPTPNTESI